MFKKRQYQIDTVKAWYKDIQDPSVKPIIAVPTGAGKSYIMCMLVQIYLYDNPDNQVLILSHTSKIVMQDALSLEEFFPDKEIAVYSSGLERKEHSQITVAGIQSAINNTNLFKWSNLVIIDEAHTVNHKNQGRYRSFLETLPHTILCGMSATIYRTGHGYIHKGKDSLFNLLSYDLTSIANYNKLIADGFLCKPVSVSPTFQLDSSKVKKTAGEYNNKHLAETHDKQHITKKALERVCLYGKKYKKWLIFAIDIQHAENINKELISLGIESSVLHSKTVENEDEILNHFVEGKGRALVSVGKITTGFDAPCIDLIVMLRPTESVVLYIQMVGRGARVLEGKSHYLVLDFCGNISKLGPINNPRIPKAPHEAKSSGEALTKICPECRTIMYISAKYCESCNYKFPTINKISSKASSAKVLDNSIKEHKKWINVSAVKYSVHKKKGSHDSLLVTYICGINTYKEWLCVEHSGYAGVSARHKIKYMGYKGDDVSVKEVIKYSGKLKKPKRILIDFNSKYKTVVNKQYV